VKKSFLALGTAAAMAVSGAMTGCNNTGMKNPFAKNESSYNGPGAATFARTHQNPNFGPEAVAQTHYDIGKAAERAGRLRNAEVSYTEVLNCKVTKKTQNLVASAHHRLAVVYDQQGEFKKSHDHYSAALKMQPDNPDVLNDLGYSYLLQGDTRTAGELFDRVLKARPNHTRALNNAGILLGLEGRTNESMKAFRAAGGDAAANANYAFVLATRNEFEKAENFYEKSLQLDPSLNQSRLGLEQVQKLRSRQETLMSAAPRPQSAGRAAGLASRLTDAPKELPPVQTVAVDRPLPPAEEAWDLSAVEQSGGQIAATAIEQPAGVRPVISPAAPTGLAALCPQANGEILDLVTRLESQDAKVRKNALIQLGRKGSNARPAFAACAVLVNDADANVRIQAAMAVWRIEHRADIAVPRLTAELQDSNSTVKALAASGLGEIGAEARSALPALKTCMADQDPYLRIYAAEACCKVSPNYDPALNCLNTSLQDSDSAVREFAAYALGNVAPSDQKVVSALLRRLQDKSGRVRAGAAFALGEIGPGSSIAVPALKRMLDDEDEEARAAAAMALKRIESRVASAAR
jgi:Tfp pilus assembly protein PilF